MSTEHTYSVAGMSCGHCSTAVFDAVTRVPGVEAAEVDLEGGRLTVRGEAIDDEAVVAAVVDAGFEVAS
jgi:copper chaperone CopZ